ncbi:MAG: cell division FtsK/SpoIIIE, partial [Bacteroidetes bacterium]|nr:cell division FtsK/SpoIIIE [Bacteroidota bacterium]
MEDTPQEEPKAKPARKKAPAKNADFEAEGEEKLQWWKDGRLSKLTGMALLTFAFLLAVAFTSYLFTVTEDQSDLLNNSARALMDNSLKVNNTLGRLGAVLAHVFIDKLFGLASYLFCVVFFVTGFNMLTEKRIFNVLKVSMYSFFGLIWLSAAFSFVNYLVHPASAITWGGAFGDYLTGEQGQVMGLLRTTGTAAALAVTALAFAVWVYNFSFDFLLKPFAKKDAATLAAEAAAVSATMAAVPVYRDESENIFAKDNLSDIKESFPMDIEAPEKDDELELVLTNRATEAPLIAATAAKVTEFSLDDEDENLGMVEEES